MIEAKILNYANPIGVAVVSLTNKSTGRIMLKVGTQCTIGASSKFRLSTFQLLLFREIILPNHDFPSTLTLITTNPNQEVSLAN